MWNEELCSGRLGQNFLDSKAVFMDSENFTEAEKLIRLTSSAVRINQICFNEIGSCKFNYFSHLIRPLTSPVRYWHLVDSVLASHVRRSWFESTSLQRIVPEIHTVKLPIIMYIEPPKIALITGYCRSCCSSVPWYGLNPRDFASLKGTYQLPETKPPEAEAIVPLILLLVKVRSYPTFPSVHSSIYSIARSKNAE